MPNYCSSPVQCSNVSPYGGVSRITFERFITFGVRRGIDRRTAVFVGTHMCTRSGKSYRVSMAEGDSGEQSASVGLSEMLKVLVEDRQRLEREHAEDRRRHEEQMELMRRLVEESRRPVPEPKADVAALPKLTKLTEQDDIEAYITVFERTMTAYGVDKSRWSYMLAPQLTGKAQRAFAAMEAERSGDYDAVKDAILRRYDINEEAYRQRLRASAKKGEETYRELATRTMELTQKWTKECKTKQDVLEMIATEQLLNTVSEEVRVWVRERKPKTTAEAGQLAEDYVQARKGGTRTTPNRGANRGQEPIDRRRCHTCHVVGHLARDCPKGDKNGGKPAVTSPSQRQGKEVECYNCHQKGHIATRCPAAVLYCGVEKRAHGRGLGVRPKSEVYRSGRVEGQSVEKVLLDTGCSRTMVRQDLVPQCKILEGDAVTVRCAHGDTVLYPLAEVELEVDGLSIHVEAAVSESLPVAVLLGTDVPEFYQLLGGEPPERLAENAMVVVTRARAQQQHEEEVARQYKELASGVQPNPVEEQVEPIGSEFADDLFVPGRSRERAPLTRRQKRVIRREFASAHVPKHELELSATQLRELQRDDNTLAAVRQAAEGHPCTAGIGFFKRDGLIYRRWVPPGCDEEMGVEQLVLPKRCRKAVLEIAHEIPLAGHMGRTKTSQRILRRFYWPTLFKDVAEFCRGCEQCQKSTKRGVQKAPLVPLPIITEPFQKIAMDIVGPLPRSRSGNRYVLVICDYATRYPEAIALRSIDAEHVAEELIKVFSRVGVPQEILTDQGSNFTSQLLTELYRLLHVHPIRTSPYHPQTDGLVERFNQTLKTMLRKTATSDGKDWDKLLPYVLFAYREVPQTSTGFSPFELLYGRNVRGPLDVLRESWEASQQSNESVVSHILLTRERLRSMSELVQQNLSRAQDKQKRWYDQTARDRELHPGDQVLVLLPTSTNKLLAQWQGPYQVLQKVGKVNYMVDMHDRRKRKRIFHINMLREFHIPKVFDNCWTEEVSREGQDDDIPVWNECPHGQPTMGKELDKAQHEQLQALFEEFADVLKDRPGKTELVEHRIETAAANPVRLPPYRLPQAYRERVQEELQEMLADGIIEPSNSDWAAPIVLVPKKDGSLRLCVDYRRLNGVSQSDAYPMPRIDELIDRLGGSKFITTLDLTRGYWQVPVAEADRHKTAFTTPFGLYQFKVMPFGLQGAPATFQRMMDRLVDGCDAFAAAYLDDLIIHSNTWEKHLQHIKSILVRLRAAGLTAKPTKCQFGMRECGYLGHVVGNGMVRPELSKVDAVQCFAVPKTKKQIRAFLGLTGYYRKFIPNYASVAVALTDLTRKSAPNRVTWTMECDRAFQRLKFLLSSSPVLRSPDFQKPFILQTDASDFGVGAVLSQEDENGDDHPVAYFSRKLLPREQRYSTIEKECLAIKLATHAFRVYLLGRQFTIQTDHRALEWLDRLKENNSRLTRWSLALQPYDFVVQHRAGGKNGNADALSRLETNKFASGEGGRGVMDT